MRLDSSTAASAMNAFSVDMMARANNIANINTDGFKARNVHLMTGAQGEGVLVGSIVTDNSPGPLVPGYPGVGAVGRGALPPGYIEGSNTDLAHEYVHMISTQRAYEANAVSIRTMDDMTGYLLDVIV